MAEQVTNVVIAGLGGQGVLTASDIVADAAFRAGCDVKKSELRGMSQRGGSVASDVRFGPEVLSPMVPDGEADFLVVLSADQVDANRHRLRPGGTLISAEHFTGTELPNRRSLNVCMLAALSRHLTIAEQHWHAAIRAKLPGRLHEENLKAFAIGRAAGGQAPP